jgi:hypothetical protein
MAARGSRVTGAGSPLQVRVATRCWHAGVFAVGSAALAAVGHHLATEAPVPYGPLSFATAALFLAVLPWVGRIRRLGSAACPVPSAGP